MKKICIISPSLKLGGIERALTTLAIELTKKNIEVHFIICLKDAHFYTLPQEIIVYEPVFKRNNSIINKFLFYPRLLFYLRKQIKKINPDRVLVFGDWFSPITLLALYGSKYPVYISDRTIPDYKFKFPIPQLKKWLYPKSAGFIAQTQRAKDFKINHFGKKLKIEVIPNALPEFERLNINATIKRENKLIYVGRFAWEKDPEILIKAMAIIALKFPDWILEMAGTGPLLEPMKRLVGSLHLDKQVVFLGKVQQVEQLYQSASILVLPSVVEGFPNTLIEGMSFGLPCVCFKEIPYEDIITDKVDGFVVNDRTPAALAEILENLIKEKSFREKVGSDAALSVMRFDKREISRKLLNFLMS